MNASATRTGLKVSALAALVSLALAGCGGGGGGDSVGWAPPASLAPPTSPGTPTAPSTPTAPITVAAVKFPSSDGIAILGAQKAIPVTVIGSNGATLTDRTIVWESSNTAIATIASSGAQGLAQAQALGTTTITATVDGIPATMKLEVKAAPTTLAEYKALFPFVAQSGQFIVASDISQAYSETQLKLVEYGWALFDGLFPTSPGEWTEIYYTWDPALVRDEAAALCSGVLAPLYQGLLRTCFEPSIGINSLTVAPKIGTDGTVGTDNVTSLAELSQSFLEATKRETYEWAWLYEGFGIGFESGSFDAAGTYTMGNLVPRYLADFKDALATSPSPLYTLDDLVALTIDRTDPAISTWYPAAKVALPQAGMLMNYLYREHSEVIKNLLTAIGDGTVTTSQEAFEFVLTGIGMTVPQLDAAYKAHGAAQ